MDGEFLPFSEYCNFNSKDYHDCTLKILFAIQSGPLTDESELVGELAASRFL